MPLVFVRAQEEKVLLLIPERCRETPVSEEDLQWIADNGGRNGNHKITLEYQHYSVQAVLSAVLPEDTAEIPTGFEMVGHIAHLNLRRELLLYKRLIGRLIKCRQTLTREIMAHSGAKCFRPGYGDGLHALPLRSLNHPNAYSMHAF